MESANSRPAVPSDATSPQRWRTASPIAVTTSAAAKTTASQRGPAATCECRAAPRVQSAEPDGALHEYRASRPPRRDDHIRADCGRHGLRRHGPSPRRSGTVRRMVIEHERRGRVEVLAINRPEARNAVNGDVAQGIEAALDDVEADDDVWAVVVTGRGPVFSAGADLKAVATGRGLELMTKRGGFGGGSPPGVPQPPP